MGLMNMKIYLDNCCFPKIDSLHIACAIVSKCDYFLTTDDQILKLSLVVSVINVNDPIGFIKEVLA